MSEYSFEELADKRVDAFLSVIKIIVGLYDQIESMKNCENCNFYYKHPTMGEPCRTCKSQDKWSKKNE